MTVQAYIIMTQEQRDAAEAMNGNGVGIGAQQIDNPAANNLGNDVMVGLWITPARLLANEMYQRWWATLGTLPIRVLDSEVCLITIPTEI
jgi:hypothetical protein